MSDPVIDQIKRVLPQAIKLRREIHAHPELAFGEHETARRLREALAGLPGLTVLPPLLETDVVAVLNGDHDGPCIALRADIDALPIQEDTGVPYASKVPGVMHACGHDGHAAVLAGTAMVLSAMADSIPGKVKFIFQPAEEGDGAAQAMCEKGVLDSPKVDAVVALHTWPFEQVGAIALKPGPAMAANNPWDIIVRGKGGHGARPHTCIDPIVTAAHIIIGLQTIVSRTVDPKDPAVVTVGKIAAGSAPNVIPDECHIRGTLRFLDPEVGKQIHRRIREIAESTAKTFSATAEVDIQPGFPVMVNDVKLCGLIERIGRELLGDDNVNTDLPVSMGADDFAFYAQKVPGVMFRLGVRPQGQDHCDSLHHPTFNFNDDAIETGIRIFSEITRRFLKHGL